MHFTSSPAAIACIPGTGSSRGQSQLLARKWRRHSPTVTRVVRDALTAAKPIELSALPNHGAAIAAPPICKLRMKCSSDRASVTMRDGRSPSCLKNLDNGLHAESQTRRV